MKIEAEKLPCLFVLSYFLILAFFSLYVEDVANGIAIDPVRLYNNDVVARHYAVQCAPHSLASINNIDPRPAYFIMAVPFTAALRDLGVPSMAAHRIFVALFSAVLLLALNGIARKLEFGVLPRLGMLAMVATLPIYFIYSFSTHETVVFAAFVVLGLYFHYTQRHLLSLLFISISSLIRAEGYPILAAWGLYYLVRFKRRSLPYLFVAAIPNVAYFLLNYLFYGDPLYVFNTLRQQADLYVNVFGFRKGVTVLETLMAHVPPIVSAYGPVFVAVCTLGLLFALRQKRFFAINLTVAVSLAAIAIVFSLLFRELYDKRFLAIAVLLAIPATALLTRLAASEKTGHGKHLAASVVAAMALFNVYTLAHPVTSPGDCCDIREQLPVPRSTMDWIRNYTQGDGAQTVYVDIRQYPILMLDQECILVKNDAGLVSPPAPDCTRVVWPLAKGVVTYVDFPEDGVLLNKGELTCQPKNAEAKRVGEIEPDGVQIYSIQVQKR